MSASSVIYLTMGAIFGLTAGISPGPLLTLVITETLRHNRKEGIKIAVAPLITDFPIIAVTYLIFSKISHISIAVSIISFLGGMFFFWLGYETIKFKKVQSASEHRQPQSLRKGIFANLLNPNPYIFWFTAGIPTAFKASKDGPGTVILYFLIFYIMLIGSKIMVAVIVDRSKTYLKERAYRIIMLILGVVLLFFAVYFFHEGYKTLKTGINL